jgi:hypothetical protein
MSRRNVSTSKVVELVTRAAWSGTLPCTLRTPHRSRHNQSGTLLLLIYVAPSFLQLQVIRDLLVKNTRIVHLDLQMNQVPDTSTSVFRWPDDFIPSLQNGALTSQTSLASSD